MPTGRGHANALAEFLSVTRSLAVLCGAGVSTASGIPDYRDRDGERKYAEPIQFQDFVKNDSSRRRYWARSYVGWQRFSKAAPNPAHYALARMEAVGKITTLITQNVDRLHHEAGSRSVIELHGDLSKVRCMNCGASTSRDEFQQRLAESNPDLHAAAFRYKPDGDADLAEQRYAGFEVPRCATCCGIVKPDVVMFGESVPKDRVSDASGAVEHADALLVVGSSLMVFSGYRFARQAAALEKPIVIVNQGVTRADDMATLKVDEDCATVLSAAAAALPA